MNSLPFSPMLDGDNTIPGNKIPEEIKKRIPEIISLCKSLGLDFYDIAVEFLDWDAMAETASYGGFPNRYPHYSFGMEWERFNKTYLNGYQRIYEMVINTDPCYIYCLNSNTYYDNINVIAHAIAHCDFFKNNVFFSKTNRNMMNEMANHGTKVRRYMSRWGKLPVEKFLDDCLVIDTLVDPFAAWDKPTIKKTFEEEQRNYYDIRKLETDHDYMDSWLNPKDWIDQEKDRVRKKERSEMLGLFENPTRNIMKYLKDNAPLKQWQQDVIAMIYEEALYFSPQMNTKMLNEGWASYHDFDIMANLGLATSEGIVEYAQHKAGVLGGKYSMNPYMVGFTLLRDIEDRWNKGKFGPEWENCKDRNKKENWDQKLGLGRDKIFEVRACHNDMTAIMEFVTPEFIADNEFFLWEKLPNGDVVLKTRDPKEVKKELIRKYTNGGLPSITIEDNNYHNNGTLLLQHQYDGRTLDQWMTSEALPSIARIWQKPVALATRDRDGNEFVFYCPLSQYNVETKVSTLSRKEFEGF